MLSDGMWNTGVDPTTVLPSMPVYTIALGDHSEQAILQSIASSTNGTYNFAPGYRQLAQIYNTIISQSRVARSVTNQLNDVSPYGYQEVNSPIDPGQTVGVLTVNWDNLNVVYTPNTPVGNQINITVYDPNGNQYTGSPTYIQPGVVVFTIPTPMGGNWTVGCWYAGASGGPAIGCTWGGFEPAQGAQLVLKSVNGHLVKTGKKAGMLLSLEEEDGTPLRNTQIKAIVNAPLKSVSQVRKKHAKELKKITPDKKHLKDGISESVSKMIMLEKKTGTSLIPRQHYPLQAKKKNETWALNLNETQISGGYTIHIVAKGYSDIYKSYVQRSEVISFAVIE